jgi:dipeptidyl aminopeptidase/acylaminoacyl peptidase
MKVVLLSLICSLFIGTGYSQNGMTPELLWKLGRVSPVGITKDGSYLIYRVSNADIDKNTFSSEFFKIPINGGTPIKIEALEGLTVDKNVSINGKTLYSKEVKLEKVLGSDYYPELTKTTAQIYTDLDYRHWDKWNEGNYNHVFYKDANASTEIDIMPNEPYYCPQMPFGGDEDYCWNNDGTAILYVSKKKTGAEYAKSTNTDIYQYDLATKKTTNLTEGRMGYDMSPLFSSKGDLAWLSMEQDGYEADKNDIILRSGTTTKNLTEKWDGTVSSMIWNVDGTIIYFNAPVNGTMQLFKVNLKPKKGTVPTVEQLTKGEFDVTGMVGFAGDKIILTRTDMNHASEVFSYDLKTKKWLQITRVNDAAYASIKMSKVERRYSTTTDGKQLLSWVIYPPDFDSTKKYPTLLYCQGGPQSALSQFYSFRWNFQVMAAQGYIIVAPNRRGMPGFGVAWNEEISKDWGGQSIRDYLTAIDDMSKESYVDTARLGAIGASYGGYSIFYLAGVHENRFKTFISHDGVFDLRSMYGTTEEIFFVNHDMGGPYWDKENVAAQKTYHEFNPINLVDKWNTPIMIVQGGIDYRVPIEQGLEAFQAAKLKGLKSKLLYFPNENHWVLHPQNGLVWQHEFFAWLKETL